MKSSNSTYPNCFTVFAHVASNNWTVAMFTAFCKIDGSNTKRKRREERRRPECRASERPCGLPPPAAGQESEEGGRAPLAQKRLLEI